MQPFNYEHFYVGKIDHQKGQLFSLENYICHEPGMTI